MRLGTPHKMHLTVLHCPLSHRELCIHAPRCDVLLCHSCSASRNFDRSLSVNAQRYKLRMLLLLTAPFLCFSHCVWLCLRCAGLDDSTSSADSFLGPGAAAVLLFPTLDLPHTCTRTERHSGLDDSNAVQHFFVFSIAHGVVERVCRSKDRNRAPQHTATSAPTCADTLFVEAPEAFIELVSSRCSHTARAFGQWKRMWSASRRTVTFSNLLLTSFPPLSEREQCHFSNGRVLTSQSVKPWVSALSATRQMETIRRTSSFVLKSV